MNSVVATVETPRSRGVTIVSIEDIVCAPFLFSETHGRHLEGAAVGRCVGYGFVHPIEVKFSDLVLAEVEDPGASHSGQTRRRGCWVHPLTMDRDAVAHDPWIGKHQVFAAQHADAAHQNGPAVGANGHKSCPRHGGRNRRRQNVKNAIDGAARCLHHLRSVFQVIAGQFDGPNPRAEAPRQVAQNSLVSSSGDDARRAHGKRYRDGATAEVACGAADQDRLAWPQIGGEETALGNERGAERTPARRVPLVDRANADSIFRRYPHLLGQGPVMEVALQLQAPVAPSAHTLECNVR